MSEKRKPWAVLYWGGAHEFPDDWSISGPNGELLLVRSRDVASRVAATLNAVTDLLAALKWAVAQIESTHSGTWQKYDADFAKARAAIKRATEG